MADEAPASTLVIFGAGGDLTKRLLVPALYNLSHAHRLPDDFRAIGVDHSSGDDAGFRKDLGSFLHSLASDPTSEFGKGKIDPKAWDWLAQRLSYQVADFNDQGSFRALAKRLEGAKGIVFYLAVSPQFFAPVVEQLAKAGLTRQSEDAPRRVVVEKPFGYDLKSAQALNARLLAVLQEDQIYRIDHFLGKETVRNIMVARFGNGVLEPLWSRLHIDSVQITAAETIGVEERGGYYDKAGALRDMVPNHLFQLLAMVAMEPPNSFDAEAVRAEHGRALEAIRVYSPREALANSARGQYGAGKVGGEEMVAYRDSPKVDPKSHTETFVALKLWLDNWRWSGVPFYLRTGKAMSAHDTNITVQFKAAPGILFRTAEAGPTGPNLMVLRIQPREGISLHFEAKRPGPEIRPAQVKLEFCYADYFKMAPATGYETLLYDCLIGDHTLFMRAQDVEAAWRAVTPFLEAWAEKASAPTPYAAGQDGPASAQELLACDGRRWRPIGA
ncbi:MAG TPA: glucose-6-phosphate dehydrogenase [Caulobacteraceae bacterium]|nr:glucose-6-phosphate dehydrogenase [Caulobacteraceae bacterium]